METVSSFQSAPMDSAFKCGQCGSVLNLKKGQLVPPCPKCGFREFHQTDDTVCC
jgi:predicted  nucleic acid-binding Zn-ribbon protein